MIRVEQLGKLYRVPLEDGSDRGYRTLRESLGQFVRRPWAALRPAPRQDFWAIRDLDFEVGTGEVLGVVGRNGAGKSTLLKLLSRITYPTTGRITLDGRVGSLLEVGTGFHPELSGRENIFLNGVILGMTRREIAAKFDQIVAFAEVEKFLDMPVKRYSRGMSVRLAFAVAAHLEPEILLVDEMLAVGDMAFQKKCLGTMNSIAQSGRTVLFVSHNLGLVRSLCPKSILLHKGQLRRVGTTAEVIADYLSEAIDQPGIWQADLDDHHRGEVRIIGARVLTIEGVATAIVDCQEPFDLEIGYEILRPTASFDVGLRIRNAAGTAVFSSYDSDSGHPPDRPPSKGIGWTVCQIPGHLLPPGVYTVSVSADRLTQDSLDWKPDVFSFEVSDSGCVKTRRGRDDGREGVITPILPWRAGPIAATWDRESVSQSDRTTAGADRVLVAQPYQHSHNERSLST